MYLTLRQNFDVSFEQNIKISYVKFSRMFLQSVKCLRYDTLCYVTWGWNRHKLSILFAKTAFTYVSSCSLF